MYDKTYIIPQTYINWPPARAHTNTQPPYIFERFKSDQTPIITQVSAQISVTKPLIIAHARLKTSNHGYNIQNSGPVRTICAMATFNQCSVIKWLKRSTVSAQKVNIFCKLSKQFVQEEHHNIVKCNLNKYSFLITMYFLLYYILDN